MTEIIGRKPCGDYEAILVKDPSDEKIRLELTFNNSLDGLSERFREFCEKNKISCDASENRELESMFKFQNTYVYIEQRPSEPLQFCLETYLGHASEFRTFYRMFRQFFKEYSIDLSPIDGLIFGKKLNEIIKECEEIYVGRGLQRVKAITEREYSEMMAAAYEMMNDIDRSFVKGRVTNIGIEIYQALLKRDSNKAKELRQQYQKIKQEPSARFLPSLEKIEELADKALQQK